VPEPLAKLSARAEVSRPGVQQQIGLGPPSGPDPVDEHAMAIVGPWILVGALQRTLPDVIDPSSPVVGMLPSPLYIGSLCLLTPVSGRNRVNVS